MALVGDVDQDPRQELQRVGDLGAGVASAMRAPRPWSDEHTPDWRAARPHGIARPQRLSADVTDVSCAAGEVSKAVFEKGRLDTYREASHTPFIVAALILLTRFAEPEALLTRWASERRPRR